MSHKLFEQNQRRIELARLLGFDSVESAEANITSEDPWVSGGKAALSEARNRILLLEDELAKHIMAGEEARAVITETKEKLEDAHRHLDEVLEDIARLREERDLARQEAERHAVEASKWRMELQTTLPEMQDFIRKQQEGNKTLRLTSTGKEDIIPPQLAYPPRQVLPYMLVGRSQFITHNPISPLGEVANATSLGTVRSFSSSPITASEGQQYKQQFELLEAQYEALRETKEKISKKFCEQLMRWKKFKHWLVKGEVHGGGKLAFRRRFLKRKNTEAISPQIVPPGVRLNENVMALTQDVAAGSPKVKRIDTLNNGSLPDDNGATDQLHHHAVSSPPLSPLKTDPRGFLVSLPNTLFSEDSLTQPSTIPTSQHSRTTGNFPTRHLSNLSQNPFQVEVDNDIPMSQQSLTQPSSVPSPSPGPPRASEGLLRSSKAVTQPKVFVVDSPVR